MNMDLKMKKMDNFIYECNGELYGRCIKCRLFLPYHLCFEDEWRQEGVKMEKCYWCRREKDKVEKVDECIYCEKCNTKINISQDKYDYDDDTGFYLCENCYEEEDEEEEEEMGNFNSIFPVVDGHFWVVRDGQIIDPFFDEYKDICAFNKCDWKESSHLPAPEITQKIMIGMFKKGLDKSIGEKPFEEQISEFANLSRKISEKPAFGKCFQNCLLEISDNGGDLVFGSLGWKIYGTDKYFYEYGGEDWKTIRDFRKM